MREFTWLFFEDRWARNQKYLGNADVEEGLARFGRTTYRGKKRNSVGRIFWG
jgi:hypothetical protein